MLRGLTKYPFLIPREAAQPQEALPRLAAGHVAAAHPQDQRRRRPQEAGAPPGPLGEQDHVRRLPPSGPPAGPDLPQSSSNAAHITHPGVDQCGPHHAARVQRYVHDHVCWWSYLLIIMIICRFILRCISMHGWADSALQKHCPWLTCGHRT